MNWCRKRREAKRANDVTHARAVDIVEMWWYDGLVVIAGGVSRADGCAGGEIESDQAGPCHVIDR